ncbi:hypothetical protein GC105_14360 [Alkalibaculum sp. M08DMB]|uniref:Uncharacterized protein n=1 Tax=Alkalibaculum sporogenes TaxID=2655001 RepID=A0A6A7KC15_9FIRM|nr:hypothetical protein [Alkalibaculum sporogenes]MPW26964.1 hypothetical protein [Alkalibaculum sporogenes]
MRHVPMVCLSLWSVFTESEFRAVQEEKKKQSNIVTDDEVGIAAVKNIVRRRNKKSYFSAKGKCNHNILEVNIWGHSL